TGTAPYSLLFAIFVSPNPEIYGKKKTLPDTNCFYHHPLDRIGGLYPAVCRDQRHDRCFDPYVGGNRVYSDLQKSKKIAYFVTKIRNRREKFSYWKFLSNFVLQSDFLKNYLI
ncbi:MAG: hypothetical protein PHH64_07010, partial [Proteiniphilum sp.]|nr:hypothetical protein [Proteiniphilum sp.]MDD4159142.1 hypothetical protein [Proteiniphilum sp.]MDD4801270.1 hypothetical protein [Proteiniphilum sp.]